MKDQASWADAEQSSRMIEPYLVVSWENTRGKNVRCKHQNLLMTFYQRKRFHLSDYLTLLRISFDRNSFHAAKNWNSFPERTATSSEERYLEDKIVRQKTKNERKKYARTCPSHFTKPCWWYTCPTISLKWMHFYRVVLLHYFLQSMYIGRLSSFF